MPLHQTHAYSLIPTTISIPISSGTLLHPPTHNPPPKPLAHHRKPIPLLTASANKSCLPALSTCAFRIALTV